MRSSSPDLNQELLNSPARGARNAASYALYSLLRLFLSREAAENINRPDKAVSPTYFNG
jgi:hypothetical protein